MLQGEGSEAVQFVRKMRGSAQAHLLRARDEHHYVVKFNSNPQGRRTLVNEWVTSQILGALGIETPLTARVCLTPAFLELNPDVHLRDGSHRRAVEPGVHFGSRYPGDPRSTAVFDFLPDTILRRVENLDDFLRVLVLDKWLGHTDARQCVFYRVGVEGEGAKCVRWVASMIDHGMSFNGSRWDFPDSPIQGLYGQNYVYGKVRSLSDFEPWLDEISSRAEDLINQAAKLVPAEWIEKDRPGLERLLDQLFQRRNRVPELLRASCQNARNSFPRWSPAVSGARPRLSSAAIPISFRSAFRTTTANLIALTA